MTTRNEKFINELIQKASQKKLNNSLPTGCKKKRKLSEKQKARNLKYKEKIHDKMSPKTKAKRKAKRKAYAKLMEKLGEPTTKNNYKKQLLNSSCGSVLKINK